MVHDDDPLADDSGEDDDERIVQLTKDGKEVWTVWWDSGIMTGEETIYLWNSSYWYPSEEAGLLGPYKTLLEALQATELNWVTDATQTVSCLSMSSVEVVENLEVQDPESVPVGYVVSVNGEPWIRGDNGWCLETNTN
jgi:hypothetical protein